MSMAPTNEDMTGGKGGAPRAVGDAAAGDATVAGGGYDGW